MMLLAGAPGAQAVERAVPLDPSLQTKLLGKWSAATSTLTIEIDSLDLATGRLEGKEWPTADSSKVHELIGWVSAAPPRDKADNVVTISFSTSLVEYGTLPSWVGFIRDDKLITLWNQVWPVKAYTWDHFTANQDVWIKSP